MTSYVTTRLTGRQAYHGDIHEIHISYNKLGHVTTFTTASGLHGKAENIHYNSVLQAK